MGPLIVDNNPEQLSGQELIEKVGGPLRQMIYKELELPIEAKRQDQIALARRNFLYMEGKQYLAPTFSTSGRSWEWADITQDNRNGKKRKFASVYNIIYGDGVKFVAVVGQRPPNVRAVPNDPMVSDHVSRADDATTMAMYLHKQWDIRRRMKEIAFYQWCAGPVFLSTHWVSDATKYGTVQMPVMGSESQVLSPAGIECHDCGAIGNGIQCEECGGPLNPMEYRPEIAVEVPTVNGHETYPKGGVDIELLTVFDVGVPFGARVLSECEWLTHDSMEPEWKLRSMYDLGDERSAMFGHEMELGSVTDAQFAKDQIESPNGVPCFDKYERALHSRKFIRPAVYHALPANLRKMMQEHYPMGAKIVIAGSKVVSIENRSMDDYWSVCKTGSGPKIADPPLCHQIIPIQDDENDFFNMGRETILRGIPKTFVDGTLLDPQAIKENEAIVGELIRVKLGTGQSIGSLMGQLPVARMSEHMMPFSDAMRAFSQEIGGVQPAIYGGGVPANTFRAENQRKNQALMQLQPAVEEAHNAIAVATKNAIREYARYGVGEIKVPSRDPMVPTRKLELENLQESGWDMEAEESVPTTLGEKQDRVAQISQENPELAAALGFNHPMNTAEMQRMFGVEGLYTPGAAQREKAVRTIQSLLLEQPIDDIDPMTGQPMQAPSQMPDPYEFQDAAFMGQVFHAWVLSPAGQQASALNPIGFENVKLFGGQLDQMAAPPIMPPPEDGGEPPPPAPEDQGLSPNGPGPMPPEAPAA